MLVHALVNEELATSNMQVFTIQRRDWIASCNQFEHDYDYEHDYVQKNEVVLGFQPDSIGLGFSIEK